MFILEAFFLFCLQALELPTVTYPLADSLPPDAIKDTKLSSLQLQGIIHAVSLPNNESDCLHAIQNVFSCLLVK